MYCSKHFVIVCEHCNIQCKVFKSAEPDDGQSCRVFDLDQMCRFALLLPKCDLICRYTYRYKFVVIPKQSCKLLQ